jgi:hypothetical protein
MNPDFFDITRQFASQTEDMLNNNVLEYIGTDYQDVRRHRELYMKSNIKMDDDQLLKSAMIMHDRDIVKRCLKDLKSASNEICNFAILNDHFDILMLCINRGYSMYDIVRNCLSHDKYDIIRKILDSFDLPKRMSDYLQIDKIDHNIVDQHEYVESIHNICYSVWICNIYMLSVLCIGLLILFTSYGTIFIQNDAIYRWEIITMISIICALILGCFIWVMDNDVNRRNEKKEKYKKDVELASCMFDVFAKYGKVKMKDKNNKSL